jgi:hypothetical protein
MVQTIYDIGSNSQVDFEYPVKIIGRPKHWQSV